MDPPVEFLSRRSPLSLAARLFLATRPRFFAASVIPLIVGTAWGARIAGGLDLGAAALALAAVLCVHAGINVLNDVYDDLGGTDRQNDERIYPYTGGSRFIQTGIMSVRQMACWGLALLALALVPGGLLLAGKGAAVLLFGLAGVALGVLYSAPPVQLGGRGLGEAAVGAGFGLLPVAGAAWLQSGVLDGDVVLLSLPVGLWVVAILLINGVPDARADAATGKRTLAVRLGTRRVRHLYLALHLGAVLGVLGLVWRGGLAPLALALPAILLLPALVAAKSIAGFPGKRQQLKRGIELTLAIHALGGLWLAAWAWAPAAG